MRRWILFALAGVPIVALLAYDIELLGRVIPNGGTHVGADTIQIAYATAVAGLVGAIVAAAVYRRSAVERRVARIALVLALASAAGFCALHWSGLVVNYDTLYPQDELQSQEP
jgi:membrane associated rhomboid family serine protease